MKISSVFESVFNEVELIEESASLSQLAGMFQRANDINNNFEMSNMLANGGGRKAEEVFASITLRFQHIKLINFDRSTRKTMGSGKTAAVLVHNLRQIVNNLNVNGVINHDFVSFINMKVERNLATALRTPDFHTIANALAHIYDVILDMYEGLIYGQQKLIEINKKKKESPKYAKLFSNKTVDLYRIDNYEASCLIVRPMNTDWCTETGMDGEEFRSYRDVYGDQYVLWLKRSKIGISIHAGRYRFMITGMNNEWEYKSDHPDLMYKLAKEFVRADVGFMTVDQIAKHLPGPAADVFTRLAFDYREYAENRR